MNKELRVLLDRFRDHPQFLGMELVAVNQKGAFDDSPLHIACNLRPQTEALNLVSRLLSFGANVDQVGDRGRTPLHVAIAAGHKKVIEALLEAKARTDIPDEDGETASDWIRYLSDPRSEHWVRRRSGV